MSTPTARKESDIFGADVIGADVVKAANHWKKKKKKTWEVFVLVVVVVAKPGSSLLPGPGPAAPIYRGGRVTEGAVSWLSSTGVGGEPPSRPSAHWDDPHFSTNRNVMAQLGKPAFLRCRIAQLGDRTVWRVRQRDLHILTVGTYTYTSDQRFHSIHLEGSEDWTLEVSYTQKGDAGVYECQVSTEPKMSLNVSLAVVVAKARIPEGSNLYIQSGYTVNLTCVVTDCRAPPVYVFWYRDDHMINYDSARTAGIRVATERRPSTTVSRLQVLDAATGDSGNYSCTPSYADPAHITVHVLNREKPAAMQHGPRGNLSERSLSSLHLITGALMSYRVFIHVVLQR
ncbi:uncharacterized protein LOC8038642 [Ixodes scapularis]|uniref:uncharacterized protein LOC8038642 n=1 Tax=Ixodes scapularis TaxID=6945 RepID=UPI001C389048|nr:uncharacterized protein LOC8038642 [Ixodes scapularis]